ncbi:unnamed protein product [Urochloa humidicola]
MASTSPQAPTATTIHNLGDDLLLGIFLRLPSLPSLVRAAFTCPLLPCRRPLLPGLPPPLPRAPPATPPGPLPQHRRALVRAPPPPVDFFLTRVPADDDAYPGWGFLDCRGGYLLLASWEAEQIYAYNPVKRALDLIPLPPDELADAEGSCIEFGYNMIASDEAPRSFSVVCLCYNLSQVPAAVFSSGTREWRVLPRIWD